MRSLNIFTRKQRPVARRIFIVRAKCRFCNTIEEKSGRYLLCMDHALVISHIFYVLPPKAWQRCESPHFTRTCHKSDKLQTV